MKLSLNKIIIFLFSVEIYQKSLVVKS